MRKHLENRRDGVIGTTSDKGTNRLVCGRTKPVLLPLWRPRDGSEEVQELHKVLGQRSRIPVVAFGITRLAGLGEVVDGVADVSEDTAVAVQVAWYEGDETARGLEEGTLV